MFVCVGRITLQIHESGSLKAKRMVIRKVTDRVKARFNVAVAEVADNDLWQRATLGLAVVGNDRRHCDEQMQKVLHAIDEMYVAPVISRQTEIVAFGDELWSGQSRSLADVARKVMADVGGDDEQDQGGEEGVPLTAEQAMLTLDRAMQRAVTERSMAEAEGMGQWEERNPQGEAKPDRTGATPKTIDEARAKARSLRNPRDWEK